MKRVLGLDLGSASIGWAIIDENSTEVVSTNVDALHNDKIVAIGSRIIPLNVDESTQFAKGQAITKNADRTARRTQRKGYDRYQLRRTMLLRKLSELGMYSGTTLKLDTLGLWGLRAKAVTEQISLLELGRVLCHINQKRGYRTVKSDFGDKKTGEYVSRVVGRYNELSSLGLTVGQFIYNNLKADCAFRCKEMVYPRDAYVEEYDAIMECQKRFYPEVLTEETISHIRNYIIFHQRPLKSCKHLVARCQLESVDESGNPRKYAPKVAPRTSPLFQVCKIWEAINNIRVKNKVDDELHITLEQKRAIFDFMNTHEKLKATDLKNILAIKSKEWLFSKAVGAGLQGNTTYCAIAKALEGCAKREELLKFELRAKDGVIVDAETGELSKVVCESCEQEPLYRLWHALYSISDIDELRFVLRKSFHIEEESVIEELCKIDFVKAGYSNKSSRAIRKILPYLQNGIQYHEAKYRAGYNDTTLTKEQNRARKLAERLMPIQKGELRQPVVEKILNQLVNLVNALMAEYGRFDEIRVELARELKQNQEERESATKAMNANQRANEVIAKRIQDEYGLTPTRARIQKYKMWEESDQLCMYCGATVNVKEFLLGSGVEVEHIIPRSIQFNDSFSNKVCACSKCNKEKNNRLAYEYMESKGEELLSAYIERVNDFAERKKISNTKRKNLLMKSADLPKDFIDRQLRESQYIAKKAKEMLLSICHNVYATSGSITDFIRHIWGWDDVLHSLNFKRYQSVGLTEMVERDVNGEKIQVERIKEWSKRMDHRHHAVDALTIACTKQGYIQRINNLSSLEDVSLCYEPDNEYTKAPRQRLTKLQRYIRMQPHFSTAEVSQAVDSIAVSFKGGKRAATTGKRYVYKGGKRRLVQTGIIIPRGALSEESIYGRIHNIPTGKEEIVIKYKIGSIDLKKAKDIVDKRIRDIVTERLTQYGGKPEKAFAEPLHDHQGREIRSVRCYTGLNSTIPVRYNEQGKAISFVKPGNNHHVAIYVDEEGRWQEHIATFWHAVERNKYGLPYIIKDLAGTWEKVTDAMPESFKQQLPESATWRFQFSMQQNEMFILGLEEELYQDAIRNNDYALLSKHLYRVQKIAKGDYYFRHHLETSVEDNSTTAKEMGKMKRLSLRSLKENNPHKVHVSVIGKITEL